MSLPSAVDLARFQFAFVVVWHFLFPALTIGLASYLAVLEGLWLATGKAVYLDTFRYWLRIFAIAFAMGVVSGIVMSYQFGTNWSAFSDKAGPIVGPLLGYEVLMAFFLEAGFLGVMLFAMRLVGKGLHFAALGGVFQSGRGAAAKIVGSPGAANARLDYGIGIPHLASLYLAHDWNAEIKGLKDFPKHTWPTNLPLVFFAFRAMVGLGFLIIGLGLTSLYLRVKDDLYDTRWFHTWAVAMGPAGFIAVTAGWITTEAGRQPFTVYGLLRTVDSVGPVQAPAIAASIAAFAIVYFVVFGAGILYLLHLFRQTPEAHDPGPQQGQPVRSAGITPASSVSGSQRDTDPSGLPEAV